MFWLHFALHMSTKELSEKNMDFISLLSMIQMMCFNCSSQKLCVVWVIKIMHRLHYALHIPIQEQTGTLCFNPRNFHDQDNAHKKIKAFTLSFQASVINGFAADNKLQDSCGCHPPCEEKTYETDVSYAYWPLDFAQLDFFRKYVLEASRGNQDAGTSSSNNQGIEFSS